MKMLAWDILEGNREDVTPGYGLERTIIFENHQSEWLGFLKS